MKILYGTTNPSKLEYMKRMLYGLDIELIGLKDINLITQNIDESGNNPLENARIKAIAYYKAAKTPVFSCDSGLYIDGLSEEEQPGTHVRRVHGKVLSDEGMIDHYSKLSARLGGKAIARYKNAICLVIDEKHIFKYDEDDIAGEKFIITSRPHFKKHVGFPLDSLSIDMKSGKYYMDMVDYNEEDKNAAKGYKRFFVNSLFKKGV